MADEKHLVVSVNLDDEDYRMTIISDDDEDDKEFLTLSINSPQLLKLRWFLTVTLQRLPFSSRLLNHIQAKNHRRIEVILQLVILAAVCFHYFFKLGAFHDKTLAEQEMKLTLTSFKNVVWNLRLPMYCFLGLFYFRSTHLDDLLSSLKLTSRSLKKAKRWITISICLVFVFSVLLPGAIRFMEMCYTPSGNKKKAFPIDNAILNTVLLIIARTYSMPIIVIFIVVFALLYFEVRQYKKHIQRWPAKDKASARGFFVNFQKQIKRAERAFQPFLFAHITILLLVFIPGILGFIERERTEGSYIHEYQTTGLSNLISNDDLLKKLLKRPTNNTAHGKNTHPTIVIIMKPAMAGKIDPANRDVASAQSGNPLKNIVQNHKDKLSDKKAQLRIALEAVAFLLETISLYIPIILLGKINKAISRLSKIIRCLEFPEQMAGGYLFQSREDVDDMLKDFVDAESVHLLGMELTVVKSLFLGITMPLFTLLIHIMVLHVDLKS